MDKHERDARRALDRRLEPLRALPDSTTARPHQGWVRAIRDALGMSTRDLAMRLDVSQVSVVKLEASERDGRARLDTLARAAEALDCDLVYALVPRTTLDAQIRSQAERVVAAQFPAVANSMRLEAQHVSEYAARDTYADLVDEVIDDRGLWSRV